MVVFDAMDASRLQIPPEIAQRLQEFTVSTDRLRAVVEAFKANVARGLREDGAVSNLQIAIAWSSRVALSLLAQRFCAKNDPLVLNGCGQTNWYRAADQMPSLLCDDSAASRSLVTISGARFGRYKLSSLFRHCFQWHCNARRGKI